MIKQRRLELLIGLAVSTVGLLLAYRTGMTYGDFNLHYFAGVLERSSTYTNTSQLLDSMVDAGLPRPGEGIYGTPTLIGLVFQPLSFLDLQVAQVLWSALCVVALTFATRKCAGKYWLLWLVVLVITPAMFLGLRLANFSTITTCLLLYAYGAAKEGQDRRLGIALALAFAFKLFPGFLLLALVLTRRWTALKWAIGVGVALLVVTVPALGWHSSIDAFDVLLRLGGYIHPGFDNVTIAGVVVHWGGSEGVAKTAQYIALALSVIALYEARRLPPHQVLALGSAFMLVSQSIAWRHYTPVLVLALLALWETPTSRVMKASAVIAYCFATGIVAFFTMDPPVVTLYTVTTYGLGLVVLATILSLSLQMTTKTTDEVR